MGHAPADSPGRRSADFPGLSALIPQVQERSENPGYKLPGWDATWGTCLEQSPCKIIPRRLKMKKRFCVIFGGPKLCVVLESKIKKNTFLVRTFLENVDK